MDDPNKKIEKDDPVLPNARSGVEEEITLDNFFQLAGIDSTQVESLRCGPSVEEGNGDLVWPKSQMVYTTQSFGTDDPKVFIKNQYEQEIADYKKKLSSYVEGQQKQAQLIQKLQTKVMQYKKRNSDFEFEVEQLKAELESANKVLQTTTENFNNRINAAEAKSRALEQERHYDAETTLNKLREEQEKSNELGQTNELLRDQLEQALQANQGLSQDVARLTLAWRRTAQQLDKREAEWREEECAFNDYFAAEHSRLLTLWRAVVALRRQFSDLKQQTDRDLTSARTELGRCVKNIQSACGNLESNMKQTEAQTQALLDKEAKHASMIESDISNRMHSLSESLARSQARLAESESKLTEITLAKDKLANQLAERDRILSTMRQLRSNYEFDPKRSKSPRRFKKRSKRNLESLDLADGKSTEDQSHWQSDGESGMEVDESKADDQEDHLKATKQLIEHTHVMHHALSQIAQLIISESTIADTDEIHDPMLNLQNPDWSKTRFGLLMEEIKVMGLAKHLPEIQGIKKDTDTTPIPSTSAPKPEHQDPNKSPDYVSLRHLTHSKYQPGSSLHLAESTVNAVQSALNRRATHVHRLRLRSNGLKEQVANLVRRLDEMENERKRTQDQLAKSYEEVESRTLEVDKLTRELSRIKQEVGLVKEQHELAEVSRKKLNEQLNQTQTELDHCKRSFQDANKQREELNVERNGLQCEHDRLVRELDSTQKSLYSIEQRAFNFREEMISVKEKLRHIEVEKEVVDQEKTNLLHTISNLQHKIDELNETINQAHNREIQLKSRISRLENLLETQEHDTEHLTHQLAVIQSNEIRLNDERTTYRSELQDKRDELDKTYSELAITQTELDQLRESLKRAESTRVRMEAELAELSRDRMALTESLAETQRHCSTLKDDLDLSKREADRQESLIGRLTNEKESVARQKAELMLQLSIMERDNRHLTEIITNLRDEKELLESNLFEAQQSTEQYQYKQSKLEKDIEELKTRKDDLLADLNRAHNEFQIELEKCQRSNHQLNTQMAKELDELRVLLCQMERRAKEAEEACLHAVNRADMAVNTIDKQQQMDSEQMMDRELQHRQLTQEVNRLTKELLAAQRDRDDFRLRAEEERQQALVKTAEEKITLQEKINSLQQMITELQFSLERIQNDASTRGNHERASLRKATEEARNYRNQLQDTNTEHERSNHELRVRIYDLETQRDQLGKEIGELQLQIRVIEEARECNRTELVDSSSRMRELETLSDNARREISELRQQFGELERENHVLNQSNDELRKQLKIAELERVDLARMSSNLQSKLMSTEMDRTGSERRLTELQHNLKDMTDLVSMSRKEVLELQAKSKKLEADKIKLADEMDELKKYIQESQMREETLKRDKIVLKQKLTEVEGIKTNMQSELTSLHYQVSELEDVLRSRERSATQATDDWQRDYQRLTETRKMMQAKLDDSTIQISELRTLLADLQSRLQSLESEHTDALAARQEAEARLSAIHSVFRRLLGYRQSQFQSYKSPSNVYRRYASKSKRFSPQDDAFDDFDCFEDFVFGTRGPSDCGPYEPNDSLGDYVDDSDPHHHDPDDDDDNLNSKNLKKLAGHVMYNANYDTQLPSDMANDFTIRQSYVPNYYHYLHQSGFGKSRNRLRFDSNVDRYSINKRPYDLNRHRILQQEMRKRRARSMSPEKIRRRNPYHMRSTSTEQQSNSAGLQSNEDFGMTNLSGWSPSWLDSSRQQQLNTYQYRPLPGSDLDPGAVRLALRRFLRHLVSMERNRDDMQVNCQLKDSKIADLNQQIQDREHQVHQLKQDLTDVEKDKIEVLEQLNILKNVICNHESALSKQGHDFSELKEQLCQVNQQLQTLEMEKIQLHNRLELSKAAEKKSEEDRRKLLHSLDNAESRYTQSELGRKRLEGEAHRLQAALTELENDRKSLQSRLEQVGKQKSEYELKCSNLEHELVYIHQHNVREVQKTADSLHDQLEREKLVNKNLKHELTQLEEHLNVVQRRESESDQEKRLLQERLDTVRTQLADHKDQLHDVSDRLKAVQTSLAECESKKGQLEIKLKQATKQGTNHQQTTNELQTKLGAVQMENVNLTEKNTGLLRNLNDLGLQKFQMDCEMTRIKKEQEQWKKMAEKAERERSKDQEATGKVRDENSEHVKTIRGLEDEALNLRREIQRLQVHMAQQDEQYAAQLVELNTKQRHELEAELERQRSALNDTQKTLQLKERSYKQRIKGLEDQIQHLRNQLIQETGSSHLGSTKSRHFPGSTHLSLSNLQIAVTSSSDAGEIKKTLNTHPVGAYKPTIAPSKYDPFYSQLTGSTPGHLNQSASSRSHFDPTTFRRPTNPSDTMVSSRSMHRSDRPNESKHFDSPSEMSPFLTSRPQQQSVYSRWSDQYHHAPRRNDSSHTSDSTIIHRKNV